MIGNALQGKDQHDGPGTPGYFRYHFTGKHGSEPLRPLDFYIEVRAMDCGAVGGDESAMLSLTGILKANANISFSACLRSQYMDWEALKASPVHTFGKMLDLHVSCTFVIETSRFFPAHIDSTALRQTKRKW